MVMLVRFACLSVSMSHRGLLLLCEFLNLFDFLFLTFVQPIFFTLSFLKKKQKQKQMVRYSMKFGLDIHSDASDLSWFHDTGQPLHFSSYATIGPTFPHVQNKNKSQEQMEITFTLHRLFAWYIHAPHWINLLYSTEFLKGRKTWGHHQGFRFIILLKETCLLINYTQPWCIWTCTCVCKWPCERVCMHMHFVGIALFH